MSHHERKKCLALTRSQRVEANELPRIDGDVVNTTADPNLRRAKPEPQRATDFKGLRPYTETRRHVVAHDRERCILSPVSLFR